MVGDLVPEDDVVWQFVRNLVKLIDQLTLSEYSQNDVTVLKNMIQYHNREYTNLFKDSLKPKHHFLYHYYRVVQESGPFKYLWTFPYEAKHKSLKSYVKNISSRRNVLLSLGTKLSVHFAHWLQNFDKNQIVFSKTSCLSINSIFNEQLRTCLSNLDNTLSYSFVKYKNILYKKNYIVYKSKPNLMAYEIKEIVAQNGVVYFLCIILRTEYSEHLTFFKKVDTNNPEMKLIKLSDLEYPPIEYHKCGKDMFLKPKFYF